MSEDGQVAPADTDTHAGTEAADTRYDQKLWIADMRKAAYPSV